MKEEKLGIWLIVLGNLLYLVYIFWGNGNSDSSFMDFMHGLLLGLSIGTNLLGIILTTRYISKNKN